MKCIKLIFFCFAIPSLTQTVLSLFHIMCSVAGWIGALCSNSNFIHSICQYKCVIQSIIHSICFVQNIIQKKIFLIKESPSIQTKTFINQFLIKNAVSFMAISTLTVCSFFCLFRRHKYVSFLFCILKEGRNMRKGIVAGAGYRNGINNIPSLS